MQQGGSSEGSNATDTEQGGQLKAYLRFGAMIATSMLVMYVLTYTNLFSIGHGHWSLERAYMSVVMGSGMTVVMLTFMWGMYKNTLLNMAIIALAVVVGATAFTLSQTQAMVGDKAYMSAMIPHHSIAILTSEGSDLSDLRVRELADRISKTQVKEIKEMDWLLDDIAANGEATTPHEAAARPVPDFTDDVGPYLRSHRFWLPILRLTKPL